MNPPPVRKFNPRKILRDISSFHRKLLAWFGLNHRPLPWRDTGDPYLIWVSEVMLQQTQVSTVLRYYPAFIRQFPDISALARADLQHILKSWERMGYYARVRNLHQAARQVMQKYSGVIPREFEEFRKLPGVGSYIAAAVTSIAFQAPYPVLDGNVKRVLSRLHSLEDPVNLSRSDKIFREAAGYLFDAGHPGTYNQAMMELGALVCRPRKPDCASCPVTEFCQAFRTGTQDRFPTRLKKSKTPLYHIATSVICRDGHLLITRRQPSGLLGGLWEFPGGKILPGETAQNACQREAMEELNLRVQILQPLTRVKHAYTHFRIEMEIFLCRYRSGEIRLNGPMDYRWILPEDIAKYPFPAANHKFFPLLLDTLRRI